MGDVTGGKLVVAQTRTYDGYLLSELVEAHYMTASKVRGMYASASLTGLDFSCGNVMNAMFCGGDGLAPLLAVWEETHPSTAGAHKILSRKQNTK
eukprot:1134494-Pelagomonas_calceolata.AAC.11